MEEMKKVVSEVSQKIEKLEHNRRAIVKAIRAIKDVEFRVGNLTRDHIINSVKNIEVDSRVGGVDGGLQAKSFHGIDIIIVRAVGVVIDYEKSRVKNTVYMQPRLPRVIPAETSSDAELILLSGLYRMIEEMERSIEVVKNASPDYLLLDGPIYPHPSTAAAKSLYPKLYRKVISLYNELMERSKEVGTRVIGVVEDSRSKYFSRILKEKIVPGLPDHLRSLFPQIHEFRDTTLLYNALNKGERTFIFKVSGIHDVRYRDEIFAFYLKTAKYDRPIRVEITTKKPAEIAEEVASLVFSLASFSTYGIPSVLIEADARAKLTEYYLEYVQRLLSKSTPLLLGLRRESRPI